MSKHLVPCPRCQHLPHGGWLHSGRCSLCEHFKDGRVPKYIAAAYLLVFGERHPEAWSITDAKIFINSVIGDNHG